MTAPTRAFSPVGNQYRVYPFDENVVDRNVLETTARIIIDASVREGTFTISTYLYGFRVKQLFLDVFLEAAHSYSGELGDEQIHPIYSQLADYARVTSLVLRFNPYNRQVPPVRRNNNHNPRCNSEE